MARMGIRSNSDESREHVRIQLEEDGKLLGYILLDPATAEKHAHDVASHRARLIDQVSFELDPQSRIQTTIDPVWRPVKARIEGQPELQGHKALALRHPGFGWLVFAFPNNEALEIAKSLTKEGE